MQGIEAKTGDPKVALDERYETFERHFLECRKALYAFIFALTSNAADTEDIFQEASVIMWRKFDRFKPGTNFRAWAKQIARNLIMDHRKRKRRQKVIGLDDSTVELLAFRHEAIQNEIEDRLDALKRCVRKLNFRDRSLVDQAYKRGEPVKNIASETEVSVQRIYKRLGTIQGTLLRCVKRTLSERGHQS